MFLYFFYNMVQIFLDLNYSVKIPKILVYDSEVM